MTDAVEIERKEDLEYNMEVERGMRGVKNGPVQGHIMSFMDPRHFCLCGPFYHETNIKNYIL